MNWNCRLQLSRRTLVRATGALALGAALPALTHHALAADEYPNKPVHIIVGLAPGGMNDIVARLLSDQLAEKLGQPVVVENKVGAGGTLGAAYVTRAPADGYTIFLGAISNMAIAVAQFKNLPYDPVKEFAPITQLAYSTNILVASPSAGQYQHVSDVIAAAKKAPGKVMFATAGLGTSPHMAGELFNLMAGTRLGNVPYKGDGPALVDVAGGQVPLAFPALPAAITLIKANKLKPIAVTSRQRAPMLPDVPTIAESGVPGYDMSPWVGMWAPVATPKDIVTRLNKELAAILKTPAVKEKFAELALVPVGDTPAEFAAFHKAEVEKWSKVYKAAGLNAE
jgi:tripartite-type tricarboxylate transporter receptor subunit TctC